MMDSSTERLLPLDEAREFVLQYYDSVLLTSSGDATKLFIDLAQTKRFEPLRVFDSLLSHSYHLQLGYQARHLVRLLVLEPGGDVQRACLHVLRAIITREDIANWMDSTNRQLPVTDKNGVALMSRTVAALHQCFDARATGMIIKFESYMLSQARITTLYLDFDEFIGDLLSTLNDISLELPVINSVQEEHAISAEFSEILEFRRIAVEGRPNTAQDWIREYFADAPKALVSSGRVSSKSRKKHMYSTTAGGKAPLPPIKKRSECDDSEVSILRKQESVKTLMNALSIPKFLAVDFVREGFDMTRIAAVKAAIENYKQARLESQQAAANTTQQEDDNNSAHSGQSYQSSPQSPAASSHVEVPMASDDSFPAAGQKESTSDHAKPCKRPMTFAGASLTRLAPPTVPQSRIAVNCNIYGQRSVVVRTELNTTIQEVIYLALAKASKPLTNYRRTLTASVSSTLPFVRLPEVHYSAMQGDEYLDPAETIQALGIRSNDTIQLIPDLVKAMIYS